VTGPEREALRREIDARRRALEGVNFGTRRSDKENEQRRERAATAKRKSRAKGINVQTHNANGYSNGCRCPICVEAHRTKQRKWHTQKRKQPQA
jgi:hypothetical protein